MEDAIPSFLTRLGLDELADERTIRRTYARLLKQTDQETDSEGFQSLREAYEIAMAWCQRKHSAASSDRRVGNSSDEGSLDSAPLPPAGSVSPSFEKAAGSGSADNTTSDSPSSASGQPMAESVKAVVAGNAEQLAHDRIDELRRKLNEGWPKDRAMVLAWFEGTLNDAKMADMDARFLFEGGVAMTLAEGWTPGHELLFGPAMEHFGWKEDRGRLAAFGRAGGIVATAIAELEFFDSQTDAVRSTQRDLIRSLREGKRPSASTLLKQMPMLEQLARLYPHWLHIITDVRAIGRWREWSSEIPAWRRKLTRKPAGSHNSSRANAPSLPYGWVFAVLLGLGALLRLFESSPSVPASPPYSGAASTLTHPSRLGEPAGKSRPVDALLGSARSESAATAIPGHATPQPARQAGADMRLPNALPATAASYAVPPRLVYPGTAKRAGRQGRVVLTAIVEADGIVRRTVVHESSGSDDLDEAAMTAVLNAVFVPAKDRSGKPIAAAYKIPFEFKLSDVGSAPLPGPPSSYAAQIRDAVRPYIIFGDKVAGNPAAELTLRLGEDGRIEEYRLTRSSGSNAWDLAVVRAIQRVPRIPADHNGKVPQQMIIAFRPKA